MEINDELIDKLSSLSRLNYQGAEREEIKKDLSRILDFVNQLSKVDTSNVEPLVHMTNESNHLRKDEPVQEITHEEALKNAPDKDSDYFRTPKILNQE
jgi:aspartyl-tRNA(Asn)/glutamyl-tRNA(Gln) amidotransferase subunit C